MTYTFTVPVVPRGKGAARHVTTKHGIHVIYKDTDTANYMASIAMYAFSVLAGERLDGPLRVDIVAVFPRSKELLRLHGRGPMKGCPVHGSGRIWAPQKPDKDNIEKAVFDALKPWLPDDKVIVCGDTLKVYAAMNENPHLEVRIQRAPSLEPLFQRLRLSVPYEWGANKVDGEWTTFEVDGLPREQAQEKSHDGKPLPGGEVVRYVVGVDHGTKPDQSFVIGEQAQEKGAETAIVGDCDKDTPDHYMLKDGKKFCCPKCGRARRFRLGNPGGDPRYQGSYDGEEIP